MKSKSLTTRLSTNRYLLRVTYYPWILLPYPARKLVTSAAVWALLQVKRVSGVNRRTALTQEEKLFSLSFWGVPRLAASDYALTVDGSVKGPLTLSSEALQRLPVTERQVSLNCVGGPKNNCVMRGVSFAHLLEMAGPASDVETAVFHCADGYFTTHPVEDLLHTEAFMSYHINGQEEPDHGYPLRLVAPEKYGYTWAKWVTRIELVAGSPKGYWERRGLPDRAWVGDIS